MPFVTRRGVARLLNRERVPFDLRRYFVSSRTEHGGSQPDGKPAGCQLKSQESGAADDAPQPAAAAPPSGPPAAR
jgi:hypothetical protein